MGAVGPGLLRGSDRAKKPRPSQANEKRYCAGVATRARPSGSSPRSCRGGCHGAWPEVGRRALRGAIVDGPPCLRPPSLRRHVAEPQRGRRGAGVGEGRRETRRPGRPSRLPGTAAPIIPSQPPGIVGGGGEPGELVRREGLAGRPGALIGEGFSPSKAGEQGESA